jgi:hypothetical protein
MASMITKRRRRAAAGLLVLFLIIMIGLLSWLAFETVFSEIRGDSGAGRLALLVFQNSSAHVIVKALVAILGLGSAAIAQARNQNALAYGVIFAAAVGIVECIAILIHFADFEIAQNLYDHPGGSSITSYEKLQSHTQIAMYGLGFWLIGIVAAQLGLRKGGDGEE